MHVRVPTGVTFEEGRLFYIDQTLLPAKAEKKEARMLEEAEEAIRSLRVRGAPAIATFACYALVREMQGFSGGGDAFEFHALSVIDRLLATRPTAVNLSHAMAKMKEACRKRNSRALLDCAREIENEDRRMCETLGQKGAELIPRDAVIMTYCNTGALATAGIGTAIGAFYTAASQEKNITVYACETRPLLQGARLTSWELDSAGIRTILIADNMAAAIMKTEKIDLVMVGADRIAHNGDTANKIGTLGLAVIARHFGVPFYVVAPSTSIDSGLSSGDLIHVEERAATEMRTILGVPTSPPHIPVRNPAFDVTPAELITAIVTEKGIHRFPFSL